MIREFRDFIAKGNVMDLAVGIIIGAAFTAIVSSLVEDIINPIIGNVGKNFLRQHLCLWCDHRDTITILNILHDYLTDDICLS